MNGLSDDVKQIVVSAWRLTPKEEAAIDRQDPTWARALALSLGLGAVLGDQAGAEAAWMEASRGAFDGRSAKDVLSDDNGLAKVERLFWEECP